MPKFKLRENYIKKLVRKKMGSIEVQDQPFQKQ